VKKLHDLRDHLLAAVPGLAANPERLLLFADDGTPIGTVGSGGFGPSVGGPIAMARIPADIPEGATIQAELRGKRVPLTVCALPFVTPSYKR